MGRNSEIMAVSATTARNPCRRRMADQSPENAFVGGASRMERWAGCGFRERRWYGLSTATP